MSPRRVLLAILASWLLIPVSCTLVAVPATKLLIESTARDLQAGEKPYLPPIVAVVDSAAPDGAVELVPLAELAARRAKTPTLTAWLPKPEGAIDQGDDRVLWRPVPSTGSAREMEVVQAKETGSHFFRYAVSKDGAVTPLRSTLYDMSHPFMAMALGFVLALLLRFVAARARRRLPPPLPPSPSPAS
jgi:hypothetical protein